MSRTQWSSQSLIGPGCHGLICTRRSSQSPARPGCHGLSCTRWSPQCLARTRSHKQIVVAHKPWPQRVRGTPCCSRPELMPLRCNVSHVRACQQVLTQVRASRHCALITPSQCDIVINSDSAGQSHHFSASSGGCSLHTFVKPGRAVTNK
jgi:hypothetical protein